MATKIITNRDMFINRFTRSGRKRNSLYKKCKQEGYNEIRQRSSKDSVVLLAYKEGSKLSDLAFMIKDDGTYASKKYEFGNSLSSIRGKIVDIIKYITDKNGDETTIHTELTYHKNNFIIEKIKTILVNNQLTRSYQTVINGVKEPIIIQNAGDMKDVIKLEETRNNKTVEVTKTKSNGTVIKENYKIN